MDLTSRPKRNLRSRKDDHLDIVLGEGGASGGAGTGLEAIRFEHCALPDMALDDVDLSVRFLDRVLSAPILISSMTGGPARATTINRNLAEAAEVLGIALAVGSQRVAIEGDGRAGLDRELRKLAPSVPLLANFGAAQLVRGYGLDEAKHAVDMIEANALIIHLNPLQEALQPEGDRNWRGVLPAIERLARTLPVPLVVKEIGCGISGSLAKKLHEAGVSVVDVAGAGGTSWAFVESERAWTEADREVAVAFSDWGIPTGEAIAAARRACPDLFLIGSGGIRDGLDAASAIRLGADMVGQAAGALRSALDSSDAAVAHFRVIIRQLQIACFCTGSRNLADLRKARLVGE